MTRRAIAILAAAVLAALALFCEEGRMLVFGWWFFLADHVPRVTVNPAAVATGLAFIGLLLAATHFVGRFLCRAAPASPDGPPRQWHFRWTLFVLLTLLVMFAAGFATIGLARHVGWLLSADVGTVYEDPCSVTLFAPQGGMT